MKRKIHSLFWPAHYATWGTVRPQCGNPEGHYFIVPNRFHKVLTRLSYDLEEVIKPILEFFDTFHLAYRVPASWDEGTSNCKKVSLDRNLCCNSNRNFVGIVIGFRESSVIFIGHGMIPPPSTPKFSYSNRTHQTKTRTANRCEITNSNPPGPIKLASQSLAAPSTSLNNVYINTGRNHFAEPNWHGLTFLHVIFFWRATYWAQVELL
jgi:hypothetical protein